MLRTMNPRRETFLLFAMFAMVAIYLSLAALLPKDVFWISDNGNRLLQMQSIIQQHFTSIQIVPSSGVADFSSLQPPHFYRLDGADYSYYPFAFPYLAAGPALLFGNRGLLLIPLLSAILLLMIYVRLWKSLFRDSAPVLPLFVLGLATPLFFYTLTFWEHTLTMLLAVSAVHLTIRAGQNCSARHVCLAGLIAGAIPWFRPEGYLFCCLLPVASFLAWRRGYRAGWLVVGILPSIAVLWFLNCRLYGSIFGLHTAKYLQLGELFGNRETSMALFLLGKLEVCYSYLFQYSASLPIGLLCGAPFLLAAIVGLCRRTGPGLANAIAAAALVGSGVLVCYSFRAEDPVFATLWTQGLSISTPFVVFFLLGIRRNLTEASAEIRLLSVLTLGFLFFGTLAINNYERGILWGGRYYLLVYPFLTILSFQTYRDMLNGPASGETKRATRWLFHLLLALSLSVQIHGVGLLFAKTRATQKILDVLAASPSNHIVTDVFWLPEEMAAIFYRKKFLFLRHPGQLSELQKLLVDERANSFDLVLSPTYSDRQLLAGLRAFYPLIGSNTVASKGQNWLTLNIYSFAAQLGTVPLTNRSE